MPNWKKLITSGSSGSLANLAVDNAITASNLNITSTGSFDRVEANTIDLDRLSLTSTQTTVPPLQLTANSLQDGVGALRIDGSQADIFLNPSTATHTTVTFAVNNDQRAAFGMDNNSDFYITRRTGGSWYDDTLVIDRDTGLLSLGYGISVTGGITGSLLSTNGILSSSAQIATDISGSITSTSSSIASDIATLVSFSSSLETTIYDYTGSFTGDGSGLTGVESTVTEQVTLTDSFTSATTHSISHTFATKNLNVTLYDENDDIFIPARINTPTTESVVIYMDPATTGRAVISKGGHLVSGSIAREVVETVTVSDTFTSATTHSVAHTFGTKDVFVTVYDSNDDVFIPSRISTPTTSSVVVYMDPATTGRVVVAKGGHLVSGSSESSVDLSAVDEHILPATNNTYDLGSPTKQWRDLYLSSASLYIDGQKVISSNSDVLTFSTDVGQSIKLLETGADDIILQTDTGNIELKGTVEILSGKKITDSAGTKVLFGDSLGITGSIDLTGTVDGIDLQAFSSSVATGLASTTADYTELTNIPAGITSGSAQIISLLTNQNLTLNNLTVAGTQTIIDSDTLAIGDNIISLNGTGSVFGGIHVNDGPASGSLLWDGTNNYWIAGASGSETRVAHNGMAPEFSGLTVDTNTLYVDSANNRVGIGITSPSAKLHIHNGEAIIATSTDGLKLSYSVSNSSGIIDTAFSDNNLEFRTNGTAKMWIANGGNVGIGTTSPQSQTHIYTVGTAGNNYYEGDLQVGGVSSSVGAKLNYSSQNSGRVSLVNLNNTGGSAATIDLGFGAISTDGRPTNKAVTITQGGSVGIGTNSPSNDVSGLHIAVASSTDQLYLERTGSATGRWWLGTANNSLYFQDDVANSTRMIIDSSGNVGIGTTSPEYKIHVSDGSSAIYTNGHFRTDSNELLMISASNWTLGGVHNVLYNGWNGNIGDYLIVKSSGNQNGNNGSLILADNGRTYFGRHSNTGSALASGTSPLDTTYGWLGTDSYFDGTITATGTISGSFSGDGSALTGNSYTETFTAQTAVTASHSLGTKNVTVQVYGSDDYMIFPTSIKTHDDNNVYVQFNSSRSGRIVITK